MEFTFEWTHALRVQHACGANVAACVVDPRPGFIDDIGELITRYAGKPGYTLGIVPLADPPPVGGCNCTGRDIAMRAFEFDNGTPWPFKAAKAGG